MAPNRYALTLDEEATGPRSAAEFHAFREAHAALPHADLRRIADHARAAAILATYQAGPRLTAARDELEAAKKHAAALRKNKGSSDDVNAARKDADAAVVAAQKRLTDAEQNAGRTVPALAPCPVDRCPGHAALPPLDLRRYARETVRPATVEMRANARKRAATAAA
jgi:hypothetical protein